MGTSKVVITLDEATVRRLDRMVEERIFPSRSKAIQISVEEKLDRMDHVLLARESAKLVPTAEQELADEGLNEIISH